MYMMTTDLTFVFPFSPFVIFHFPISFLEASFLFLLQASSMVDLHTVCCMCGDIGFPDKLFRCSKCCQRFQHSYCSNYYDESSSTAGFCDWCLSEERGGKHGVSSKKYSGKEVGFTSNEKIKQNDHRGVESAEKGKNTSGTPSPKPTNRRYKFLKDVMC